MKHIFSKFIQTLIPALFSALAFAQETEITEVSVSPDSIGARFTAQLQYYPQEKIHVLTDKSCYVTGETVWFRIYLVNAFSNHPDTTSRYVYAELINPLDSLIQRVKIRPTEGVYHGHIALEEDLPEGDYQLRFYTRFMEGLGDDYFFKKKISVGDPMSALYRTEAVFSYTENKKRINAELHFIDIASQSLIKPESVQTTDDNGILKKINPDADTVARTTINVRKNETKNVLYVEYDYMGKPHKEYIPITTAEDDFDVSFFPEGGQLPEKTQSYIAFKSLNSNGLGEDITGVIVDEKGDTLNTFQSRHRGMGFLLLHANAGEKYYAICKNSKNKEKRFELPPAGKNAVSLHVGMKKDRVIISPAYPPDFQLPDTLFLIAHCRGFVLYSEHWDKRKEFISILKKTFPSGVIHLLLADAQLRPISERLIFIINENEFPLVSIATDKPAYGKREKVNLQMNVTDNADLPLNGDFAISVTDDKDVLPDTCVNILSTLLLTSELKGYIESPAYYFQNDNPAVLNHLDILMMTQGWRRYDIPAILKGEIAQPKTQIEFGPRISGTIKGGVLMNRPSADYPVSILSFNPELLGQTTTDAQGHFVFNIPEAPENTRYIVQGNTKKGGDRVELLLDPELFPSSKYSLPFSYRENRNAFENYLEKAEQKFILDNGMRMIYLKDVEVTAKRLSKKGKSPYSSPLNTLVTSAEIEKKHFHDMFSLLMTIPGIIITGDNISIRGGGTPLFLVDGYEMEIEYLRNFVIEDVDEVEIVKGAQAAIFGSRGGNGAIMITTKRGFDQTFRSSPKFNMKPAMPLGYQTPKEFYSPRYETPEEKREAASDLRTTIYWNPNVKIINGKAELNFYTADIPSTYSVVIEGISEEGALIHVKETISREK
jgi:TonB-dependent SusC/RagA subfamily outer membrane receptor